MSNKIIINGKFVTQKITGVQRYAWEMLKVIDSMDLKDISFELAVDKTATPPSFKNIVVKKIGKLKGNLWEQISLPRYAKKEKCKVLSLCNSAPISSPNIIVIHDMKIRRFPQFFKKSFVLWYKFMFKRIIKKSELILTNSLFSKSEILNFYKVPEDKIQITYLGHEHIDRVKPDNTILDKFNLKKGNYYFSLGSLDPNKNFAFITSCASFNKENTFVVSGGINNKIFSGSEIKCPENVIFTGYVTDEEIKALMANCKAFIFPSFYEGFGIPPLEAIASGCSCVILSDIPVMREIFGNYASYVDPNKKNASLELLIKPVLDKDSVLNKFTWKNGAAQMIEALRGVANK